MTQTLPRLARQKAEAKRKLGDGERQTRNGDRIAVYMQSARKMGENKRPLLGLGAAAVRRSDAYLLRTHPAPAAPRPPFAFLRRPRRCRVVSGSNQLLPNKTLARSRR